MINGCALHPSMSLHSHEYILHCLFWVNADAHFWMLSVSVWFHSRFLEDVLSNQILWSISLTYLLDIFPLYFLTCLFPLFPFLTVVTPSYWKRLSSPSQRSSVCFLYGWNMFHVCFILLVNALITMDIHFS